MRKALNLALLLGTALLLAVGVLAFGGVFLPYAAPIYVVAGLLALLWAAKLLLLEPVSWTRSVTHWPVILFAGYAVARYFTSPIEFASRTDLLPLGVCVLVYFVAATTFRRNSDRTVLVTVLAALAFAESLYALWQFATHHNVVWNFEGAYERRGTGSFFNPNHLGGLLEITFCLLLARIIIDRSNGHRQQPFFLRKILDCYFAAFALAGLYTTLSRGAWVSVAAGVVAFLLWCWRSRDLSPRVVDAGLILVLLLGIVFVSRPELRQRFRETVTLNPDYTFHSSPIEVRDATMGLRVLLWRPTWQMIRDHPIFGTGPGTWEWRHLAYRDARLQWRPEYAHGDLLQLAAEYGAVGWLLMAAVAGCFFWQVARIVRQSDSSGERAFAIGSAVGVTAILVHSLVDFNLHIPANALLVAALLGFTAAMSNGHNFRWRETLPRPAKWGLATALIALAVFFGWTGVRTTLASHDVWTGNEARQAFAWDDALTHYARALRLDPRAPAAYAELGELYRLRSALAETEGQPDTRDRYAREAVAAFEQSLRLNPYDSDILLRLGSAYELADQPAPARHAYERALQLDPNNGFAYVRLGVFCDRHHEREAAIVAFTKALELVQNDRGTVRLYLKALGPKP